MWKLWLVKFILLPILQLSESTHVLLFGATGRTGRYTLVQALDRGHRVTAFVRDESKVDVRHPQLTLFQGDVLDAERVKSSMEGIDTVISALGRLDADQRVVAAENIIAAMHQHGARRIIAIGGLGCLQLTETMRHNESPSFPAFFRKTSLAHWEVCRRLMASGLDWTFMCPPEIRDGPPTASCATCASYAPPGGAYGQVTTGDLARCMLDAADTGRSAPTPGDAGRLLAQLLLAPAFRACFFAPAFRDCISRLYFAPAFRACFLRLHFAPASRTCISRRSCRG